LEPNQPAHVIEVIETAVIICFLNGNELGSINSPGSAIWILRKSAGDPDPSVLCDRYLADLFHYFGIVLILTKNQCHIIEVVQRAVNKVEGNANINAFLA